MEGKGGVGEGGEEGGEGEGERGGGREYVQYALIFSTLSSILAVSKLGTRQAVLWNDIAALKSSACPNQKR